MERTEELMQKAHCKILEILTIFDDLCKKLNLKYTLSSGTLLGAVRHKGFIPWDDDVDVAMPREDYEIFIKNANSMLPDGFFLQHYTTDKHYMHVFAKLKNSNTTWIESGIGPKKNMNHGIYIDIFPIDLLKDPKKLKGYRRKTWFLSKIKSASFLYFKNKSFFNIVGKILLYPLAKIIGVHRINRYQDTLIQKLGPGEYTTADYFRKDKYMPYSYFETFTELEFEGKKFSAIKEYDKYLTHVYGDYMTPPPPEKRKVHPIDLIDVDRPYTYYVNKGDKKCKR